MCLLPAWLHITAAPETSKIPDACALLSNPAIEKVQGAPLKAKKGSVGKSNAVITSQCFFALANSSDSISLVLTIPNPANSRIGPRELWEKWFHESAGPEKEPPREKETEKGAQPVPVSGLGDEAYWVQSFVGTLYVLRGNAFFRISIGGKQNDAARLQKARILAMDVLPRMP